MKDWLRNLFCAAEPEPLDTDHAHLAGVALLYEVMRADHDHRDSEIDTLLDRLCDRWQLEEEEARHLLERASREAEKAVDYHQLVSAIRQTYDATQRSELVADMWAIAHADGHVDPQEEYVIRKVADLLYVPHSHFIRGKLQAENPPGG